MWTPRFPHNQVWPMKILIDCDTGIDDALAIFCLSRLPCEVVAAGVVHGNIPVEQAARNTRFVLDMAGLKHTPAARGCAEPLKADIRFATAVHGEDGLAGLAPEPTGIAAPLGNAVAQIVELGRRHRGKSFFWRRGR